MTLSSSLTDKYNLNWRNLSPPQTKIELKTPDKPWETRASRSRTAFIWAGRAHDAARSRSIIFSCRNIAILWGSTKLRTLPSNHQHRHWHNSRMPVTWGLFRTLSPFRRWMGPKPWMGGANSGILKINRMDLSTTMSDHLYVLQKTTSEHILTRWWDTTRDISTRNPCTICMILHIQLCIYTSCPWSICSCFQMKNTTVARIQNSGLPLCSNIWWWPQVKRQDGAE